MALEASFEWIVDSTRRRVEPRAGGGGGRVMQVDFGRTADDYGKHRAGFPEAFFQRLEKEGVVRPGLRAVDFGTGTGTVARGLARSGCKVTGLDIAEPMLETARQLAA